MERTLSKINMSESEWKNKKFGTLIIISKLDEKSRKRDGWIEISDILLTECSVCKNQKKYSSITLVQDFNICQFCKYHSKNIGIKIGKLTVQSFYNKEFNKGYKRIYYRCLCDCGNIHDVCGTRFKANLCTTCSWCRNSYTDKFLSRQIDKSAISYFKSIIKRSKNKNIEINITLEYIMSLLDLQNQKCSLSGVDIQISDGSASLDRIDSSKGYIVGNVQWVYKPINFMKQSLSQDDFKKYCKLVANYS